MDEGTDRGRRRICAVAYTDYLSDPRVRREAEALASAGCDVTVLSLRRADDPPDEVVDGVRVVHLPVRRQRGGTRAAYLRSYGAFFVRAAVHLATKPRRFDLVHVHSIPEALVFAAIVQRAAGTPVLLDVHDLSSELYANRLGSTPLALRAAEVASLRFATRVVTVHDRYRDLIVERGVSPDKVDVVLNAPDERLFGEPRRPAWRPGPLRLSYHGTFVERYGLDVAIDAVARLRRTLPDVRLALHGDGDHRAALVGRIEAQGLEEAVHLSPGAVPVHDVPRLVSDAHIGLVPFLDTPFTADILPTKLLEYVLLGIPVVVTRNRVVERYFGEDTVTYVRPGDVDDLVGAVRALWADPPRALGMAAGAQRAFAEHRWSNEQRRFRGVVDGMVAA